MNKISAHLLVVRLNDIYDVFQTASTWSVAVVPISDAFDLMWSPIHFFK